ncbi:OmpA family protein [Dyadobacter tibetensis]|uniref:OmpA family protein n=1 Tax=Dyadobacter tibetensis TaxID=1211851 RepID=UPI00047152C3|nr:OmpA family protein [Dyadobacter tibetensis]
MSKNNTFWWLLLFGWIGAATWWHNCHIKFLCDESFLPTTHLASTDSYPEFKINDGASFSVNSVSNFGFARSGSVPQILPIKPQLDSLVAYLNRNPSKRIELKGYYHTAESNPGTWPNLGIARAEAMKAWFVEMGIDGNRISTAGVLHEELVFEADSLRGGLEIGFVNPQEASFGTEKELADQQKFGSIFEPLDLYFSTGSSQYIRNADNESFVEHAMAYLKDHPDKKLLLIGHTDNTGNEASNLSLSRRRAEAVKQVLVQRGMAREQIAIEGKGQQQPKADNNTPRGRSINRRCSIIVQ